MQHFLRAFAFFFSFFALSAIAKTTPAPAADPYKGWKEAAISYVISKMGESQKTHYAPKTKGYANLESRWNKMFPSFRKVWKNEPLWKQKVAMAICLKETYCGLMTPTNKWGKWVNTNDNGTWDCGLTQINQGSTKHSCAALNASDVTAFKEQKRILRIKVLHKKTVMVDDTSKPRLKKCKKADLDLEAPKHIVKRKRWVEEDRWVRIKKGKNRGKKVKVKVKVDLEEYDSEEYQCRYPQKWVTPKRPDTLKTWLDHVWRYNGAESYGERVAKIYQPFM